MDMAAGDTAVGLAGPAPSGWQFRPATPPRVWLVTGVQRRHHLAAASRSGRHGDHRVAVTGSIEVGVDFPQSREFQPRAKFADREGTERDLVFVWLNPAAVLKEEHQMGDVLAAEAIRHLPGIQHQASL